MEQRAQAVSRLKLLPAPNTVIQHNHITQVSPGGRKLIIKSILLKKKLGNQKSLVPVRLEPYIHTQEATKSYWDNFFQEFFEQYKIKKYCKKFART